jgi:hypothetical protein
MPPPFDRHGDCPCSEPQLNLRKLAQMAKEDESPIFGNYFGGNPK